jgi:hypothetical protein
MPQRTTRSTVVLLLAVLAFVVSSAAPAMAKPSGHSHSSGGTLHVKAYTKKDGTYVAPHDRHAPTSHGSAGASSTTEDHPARETHSKETHLASGETRDNHGRIVRSEEAKHAFEAQTGFPHGLAMSSITSFRSRAAAPTLPRTCSGRPWPRLRRRTNGNARAAINRDQRFPTVFRWVLAIHALALLRRPRTLSGMS